MTAVRILGAGVMGLVLATELTARGHRVELVDPAARPGPQACSWWAGGMLAPHCEGESAEEPVERLGLGAADWWARHAGGVARNGTLVLALPRERDDLARFARRSRGHQRLDAAAIAGLEPDLAGRFDGYSLRVPTPTVSIVDFMAELKTRPQRITSARSLSWRRGNP